MPVKLVKSDGEWSLTLEGVVDIFEVAALTAIAREAAGAEHGLVVDLAGLEALDTSTTQLLLALKRALATTGGGLRLEAVPDAVVASWRSIGLDEALRG